MLAISPHSFISRRLLSLPRPLSSSEPAKPRKSSVSARRSNPTAGQYGGLILDSPTQSTTHVQPPREQRPRGAPPQRTEVPRSQSTLAFDVARGAACAESDRLRRADE